MEAMTITAYCRIGIPIEDGLAMDTPGVTVIGMAGSAFLDHTDLVPFPGGQLVNLFMTIFTLNLIDEMGAGIMFCRFLLMTAVAGGRLAMDSCLFFPDMFFDIGDIPVATITRICSMDRLGKLSFIDLTPMTSQTFRIIDTLVTVFAAFDDKLLALFLRFRRLHAFGRLGAPFLWRRCGGRDRPSIQKERETKGEKNRKEYLIPGFHRRPPVQKNIPRAFLIRGKGKGRNLFNKF
jgi:hypothetical protein